MPASENKLQLKMKRQIKSMSNRIGLSLLGCFVVMVGWSFVFLYICALFGVDNNAASAFLENKFGESILQTIVSVIMSTIPFLILCRVCLKKPSKIIDFTAPKGKTASIFCVGLGFCYFAALATEFAGSVFESIGISAPSVNIEGPDGLRGFLLSICVTALLPAFIEEFAMRGIVLGLLRKFGDGFAIICSAIAFGVMHASAEQIPFAAAVGLALGFVVVKTKSIWPAVAIHFANNFLSVVLDYVNRFFGSKICRITDFSLDVIILIMFIVGICSLSKKDDDFFRLEENSTDLSIGEKLTSFFLTPGFIAAVIFSLLISFFLR